MLGKRFGKGIELSGGEWQKLAIARAYMREADILILDEPTTALDILTQRNIMDVLKELRQKFGFSMLFISHDLALAAELADRVATVYAGQDGMVRLSDEAAGYFKKKDCEVKLSPTPQALETWNKAEGKAIGLFHVTC